MGFIPDKLGKLSKLLPDNIKETTTFGGCYGSNIETSTSEIWFDVKLVNKSHTL